jgi:group I intron endonuclease
LKGIGKRSFSTVQCLKKPYSSSVLNDFVHDKNLYPVVIYDNLEEKSTRDKILQETNGASGIYLILNKITLDYYIGSASTNKLYAKFSNHLVYLRGSKLLKNAVKKYDISSFAFLILEIIPEKTDVDNNRRLIDLEDFYLKSLLPNYNILTEAGCSFGYKHTEITRIKMKANYSEQRRNKICNLNRNTQFSIKRLEAMRAAALNREKFIYSEQDGGLASDNVKNKSQTLRVRNLNGTIYGEYKSIPDAALNLNCKIKTITRSFQTPKKLLKRRWIVEWS